MKIRTHTFIGSLRRFRADERGQALVESLIVIPLILFTFFAIVQLLLIGFTYQAVKHAAFMSARSLAVHHAVNEEDAVRNAKAAACIALVPASQPAPGEVALMVVQSALVNFNGIVGQTIVELGLDSDILELLSPLATLGLPGDGFMGYGTRLATARHRLGFHEADQSPEGFRWQIRPFNGAIDEVLVDITYKYPLYVPGFSELWDYLQGPGMDEVFELSPEERVLGMPASIRLPARVAVGYEPWSGQIRLQSAVELDDELRSDGGGAPANPLDGIEEALDEAKALSEQAKEKEAQAKVWRDIQEEKEALYQQECEGQVLDAIKQVACDNLWNEAQNAKAMADNLEAQAQALANQAANIVDGASGQLNDGLGDAVSAVNDLGAYLSAPCP